GPRKIMGPISVHLWKNAPMLGECPEVAIIGRSNAGKSTLVNSLLGYDSSYTKRAPVSSKPGETQALQFYVLRKQYKSKQPALGIVDMPGYGFSFTSEKEAQRCFTLNSSYIRLRGKNLKRVLLVVDARHGLKRTDFRCLHDLMSNTFRDAGDITTDPSADFDVKFDHSKKSANDATWKLQIILTKCDLVERLDLARRIAAVRDQVRANFFEDDLPVMMVSAAKGLGIVELQKELSSLVILDRVEKME
ncbi:engB, partial [Symbiodinium microadriaticum]